MMMYSVALRQHCSEVIVWNEAEKRIFLAWRSQSVGVIFRESDYESKGQALLLVQYLPSKKVAQALQK